MEIRELDEETVRQIAAGEVVERPASVVKELIENSLDAAAARIDIVVDRGGKDRIRVADDGIGMTREAVTMAVENHTTSKLTDATDLRAVGTLGFRGEALHAIGAVSTMTITTTPRGDDHGTRLRVDHGTVVEVEPAGRPAGTTVEVSNLFDELPARKKFLGTDTTEFDHVNRIATRYALANPSVAVSLTHGDREIFATTGQGNLQEAILSVYGREVAESMIELDADGVRGVVSHPETTRSTRDYLSTYVNGRYVSETMLREAVLEAYGTQLSPDRYPFAIVFVEVDSGAVDVNVHPRKLEVRFDDPAAVRDRVRRAVRTALIDHGLIRSSAPRGPSAPEDASLTPEKTPPESSSTATGSPWSESVASPGDDTGPPDGRSEIPSDLASSTGSPAETTEDRQLDVDERESSRLPADQQRGESSENSDATSHRRVGPTHISAPSYQATLDEGRTDESRDFDRLPAMRILGQIHDLYLVAETGDGLLLVDQHAADERVNYERLRDRIDGASQMLADPVELELTAREAALLPAFAEALSELGFRVERTDDRAVTVRAVPAVLAATLPPDRLRDVLGEAIHSAEGTTVDAHADAVLGDLACYPAITGHTPLTEGSMLDLLATLDGCENPYACPHGRPVLLELDWAELAERFERDYPGHGGRRPE